jgi:hypothetical protein
MYAGYTGFRPRLQLWHGDADSVLSPVNQTESIKQWTNVMGLDINAAVTTTETLDGSEYVRQQWMDSCGNVVLDAWTEPGGQHGTAANMTAARSIPFLALDQPGPTDPQTACVPDTGAGGGTATGAGGSSSGSGNPGGPAAEIPTRPTMACSLSTAQGLSGPGRSGTAVFAVSAIALAFAGRRRRQLLRAGAGDK